jgi:pimeloyl-ACP methyl ester carboxylesterase
MRTRSFLLSLGCLWFAAALWAQTKTPGGTHGFLTVGGSRIYYEECGTGTAVVLLHDGLLHSVVWEDMWSPLCAKNRVIRYDRRGYGRSEPAKEPFSPEADLALLLQSLRVDRAVLVGSSSGSAVALDFTLAHPERVEALVMIGPVVHGMRSSDYFVQRGNARGAPLAKGDFKSAAENWSKDRFQISGDRPEARKKVFDALVGNPQNLQVPGQFEIRPTPPTVTRLAAVQAPTLVIVGEDDIADVHAFAGAIQAGVPVVRREVWKGDGHLVQLEEPQKLVERLEAFVGLAERKTIPLPAAALHGCAGTYSFLNAPARVEEKGGHLVLQLNGDADIILFAESESRFFIRTTGTEVQFERDAAGETVAMVIKNAGGDPIRCPRL